MNNDYFDCLEYLSMNFEEVNGFDFYRDIFPHNENSTDTEKHTDFSHPNAIFLYHPDGAEDLNGRLKLRRRIMFADRWESDYMEFVEQNTLALCSGLSYRGGRNLLKNAQRMNALIFDLDGVGLSELENLFLRFGGSPQRIRTLPRPTFIVLSGSGLHLYYVFAPQPIDLYPNIKLQMKALKYDLTFRMWEYKGTSKVKSIQYQSISQGFRMVGSVNDKPEYGRPREVRAFRVGPKVPLEYMNSYVKPEARVDLEKPFRPSQTALDEAKVKYPEWYQRVIVEGRRRPKKWDIAGKCHGDDPYALYHWWLRQIVSIRGGHRYFFLMCAAIYAYKCDVPKERLKRDMKDIFDDLQEIHHTNPLTQADIDSALEAYDREYYNFTIRDIEKLTDVRIERNKRNGRKQEQHLERARAVQSIDYPDGSWRNVEGRPKGSGTAERTVREWRQAHPEGRKADCHRDTGLDPKTIRKWWDVQPVRVPSVEAMTPEERSAYIAEYERVLFASMRPPCSAEEN